MNKHRVWIVIMAGAMLSAFASLAWGCTRQPTILALSPRSGMAGSVINLQGLGAPAATDSVAKDGRAAQAPVEVRWNSVNGPILASAHPDPGGRFSIGVPIPSVAPGVYFLVTVDAQRGVARQAFSVTGSPAGPGPYSGSASDQVSQQLWSGFPSVQPAPVPQGVQILDDSGASPGLAGIILMLVGIAGVSSVGTIALIGRSRAKRTQSA